MPSLAVGQLGVGLGVDNKKLGILLIHTIAFGGMNVQLTEQAAEGFVLIAGEGLIPEHQDMVLKKRRLNGGLRFRVEGSKINAGNFRADGGGNRRDVRTPLLR